MSEESGLAHLQPMVAKIALMDDQSRIDYIRKDRFITHARARGIMDELEMLKNLDDAIRPQGRLLAGYSLMGKTTIVAEFVNRHRADDNPSGDSISVPVVYVQYPESASGNIYGEILSVFNTHMPARARLQDVRSACVDLLRLVGMRILIIDEFHNILEGSAHAQARALNSIKYLMNELHRPVVVIGTEAVIAATRTDRQISSRLPILPLERFKNDDDFLDLLAAFELILPLRKPSTLYDPTLAALIYKHTVGITGDVADLLNSAAIMAIESGTERITEEEIEAFKNRRIKADERVNIEELLG